jgi:hypothetical protein
MRTRIRQVIAFGMICLVLACPFIAYSTVRNILLGAATCFFLAAIGMRVYQIKTKDPYSLEELREMVIDRYNDNPEVPEVDPDGDLYCIKCDSTYNAKFRFCPSCSARSSKC